MELALGVEFDLTRRATQQAVLALVRTGKVWAVHLGTPCSAWSIARRGVTNHVKARNKELISVELALFSSELVVECSRCGVRWSIENPSSSKLWSFEPISKLLALPGARFFHFNMCRYGVNHLKPTSLLTDISALEPLSKRCNHAKRHVPLAGSARVIGPDGRPHWVSATAAAAAYPLDLCKQWSRLLRDEAPVGASGPQPVWIARWCEDLHGLVRRSRREVGDRRLNAVAKVVGDERATVFPGTADKYLRKHDVVFGGSVGLIAAGTHAKVCV